MIPSVKGRLPTGERVNLGAEDDVGASAPVADLRGRDPARCDPVVNRRNRPPDLSRKLRDGEVFLGGVVITHDVIVTRTVKLRQEARQKILKNFADRRSFTTWAPPVLSSASPPGQTHGVWRPACRPLGS